MTRKFTRIYLNASVIFLVLIGSAHAQEASSGIRFFNGSWKELLLRAKNDRKIILVDVFTDWCGPCKMMDNEVFTRDDVGIFYNSNFINYRLNGEKGEGPDLAKQYGVRVYPTWLFVEADGTLRMRSSGFLESHAFISLGKEALLQDAAAARLAAMERQFTQGLRDTIFLRNYLETRSAYLLDNAEVLDVYLQKLDEHSMSAAELRRLINFAGRNWSTAIPRIASHLNLFEAEERREMAQAFFNESLYFIWGNAIKSGDWKLAAQVSMLTEKIYPYFDDAAKLTADHAALLHFRKSGSAKELKKIGHRLAKSQMSIPEDMIRQKDQEMFDQVMRPFFSGERDSTKILNFAEEKRFAATQYSAKVAGLLYEVAEAFDHTLPAGDAERCDALIWARRAYKILPSPTNRKLLEKLESKK